MESSEFKPFILGYTEEGLPQYSCDPTDSVSCGIGFDPERRRLVEIRQFGGKSGLGILRGRALRERLSLVRPLYHPGLAVVLGTDSDGENRLWVASEFVDGERLFDYLLRLPKLPRHLGIHLALQIAEITGYLADYPRLLATVRPNDFLVCLERGHRLRLRLADFGLERDDIPVSDSELGSHWIEMVGLFLEHFLEGRPLPSAAEFHALSPGQWELSGALGSLINRLRDQSGPIAIRELRDLRSTLLLAAGFSPKHGEHLKPEFSSFPEISLRPLGPLGRLIGDSAELEELIKSRWRTIDDVYPGDGISPYLVRSRSHRAPSATLEDRGERFDLLLLPPERLVDNTQATRLNHQMGHCYLKDHPSLVRTRSIHCDKDFTLVASQGGNGFTLMEWIDTRGNLGLGGGVFLLEQVIRLLAHLEGAEMDLDRLDPWRLLFHFDESLPPERIKAIATTMPPHDWPAVTTRLRPVSPVESLVSAEAGSWRHLLSRLGGKSLPTLILWSLESDRFDQLLGQNRAVEAPLSDTPGLAALFAQTAAFMDCANAGHRQRFLELLQAQVPLNAPAAKDESSRGISLHIEAPLETTEAEVIPPSGSPRRRGWRFGRPVAAS